MALKRKQFIVWFILMISLSFSLTAFGADHLVAYWENIPCVLWCRGCAPTSASMVLGYYDRGDGYMEILKYGRLIDYWREYTKYSDGTGDLINVPNVLNELRVEMKTTHLIFMIVLFAAGIGLMLRSYTEQKKKERK